MVLLTMTPSIVEAIAEFNEKLETTNQATFEQDLEGPSLQEPAVGKPISHGQIIEIWKKLRNDGIRLEILLKGASIYVPPPPPKPEPTPEYKALMARLRREEEERSYERMTQKFLPRESFAQRFPAGPMAHSFAEVNRPTKASDIGETDIEFGDVQRQVTLIINFLVSIIGSGAAIWLAARWWSVSSRIFLSLGGALVVAIAEVAVYSAFTWRMNEGGKNETKKREVKEVIQTWVLGEEENNGLEQAPPVTLLGEAPSSEVDPSLRRRLLPQS